MEDVGCQVSELGVQVSGRGLVPQAGIPHSDTPSPDVFKAHRLCVSLSSRLESNKGEEKGSGYRELVFHVRANRLLTRHHRVWCRVRV